MHCRYCTYSVIARDTISLACDDMFCTYSKSGKKSGKKTLFTSHISNRGYRTTAMFLCVCVCVCVCVHSHTQSVWPMAKRTLGQKDCTMGDCGRYINAQAFSFYIYSIGQSAFQLTPALNTRLHVTCV